MAKCGTRVGGTGSQCLPTRQVITGRHEKLRQELFETPQFAACSSGNSTHEEGCVWNDLESRRLYSEAASCIGSREWVQQGIDWCSSQANNFFVGGGQWLHVQSCSRAKAGRCGVPKGT